MLIHIFLDIAGKNYSVIVNYAIKARQLNHTTVIYVLDVELLDGGKTNNYWWIRFLVSSIETFSMSFHKFLKKFIRRVLITDSVLSYIGAFELIVFQNTIDKLDFPQQQQTDRNILRN